MNQTNQINKTNRINQLRCVLRARKMLCYILSVPHRAVLFDRKIVGALYAQAHHCEAR